MDASLQAILVSSNFKTFLASAKAFCNFIEHSPATGKSFLVECQDYLLNLYYTARKLADAGLGDSKDVPDLPKEDLQKILKSVGERMPFQYYWMVLDPLTAYDHEEGLGDVTDDVVDIYKDLKPTLLLIESSDEGAKTNAIWRFKSDFNIHWNDNCINALHAIHHYLEKHKHDE